MVLRSTSSRMARKPRAPVPRRQSLIGDGNQSTVREFQFDPIQFEELGVLADERVLRFTENADQRVAIQIVDRGHQRQPADELGNQPEFDQILGEGLGEQVTRPTLRATTYVGPKTNGAVANPTAD